MLEGKRVVNVADKAVSTSDDPLSICVVEDSEYYDRSTSWNILAIDNLITTLINNKLIAIRELEAQEVCKRYDSDSSIYSLGDTKHKRPPDKKSRHPAVSRQCSRCSQKHCKIDKKQEQGRCISNLQKWSEDIDMETSFTNRSDEEISVDCKTPQRKKNPTKAFKSSGATSSHPGTKHKKKKRTKNLQKKTSEIDPEDLPKRARWTIIITSGLLILTCIFLVGITLRMAPVIDQMVRTKNEELMNSLNRDSNSDPAYYSAEMWDRPPPMERAKQKHNQQNG